MIVGILSFVTKEHLIFSFRKILVNLFYSFYSYRMEENCFSTTIWAPKTLLSATFWPRLTMAAIMWCGSRGPIPTLPCKLTTIPYTQSFRKVFMINYNRVHISLDEVFCKILKKPQIVQKKWFLIWKSRFPSLEKICNSKWPTKKSSFASSANSQNFMDWSFCYCD